MTKLTLNSALLREKSLRAKRAPLLDAFDIIKSLFSFGILTLTETEHAELKSWYYKVLDLDDKAIMNPPEILKRYL